MATKRNARVLSYGLLLFGAAWAAALASSACSDDQDDCALNPSLGCGPYETATGGSGGNGGDGGGGGVPAGCVPSEADGPVGESCGVFVSVSGSDDAGNGSQGAPYATIGKGLTEAGGQPVYVCVGDYAEAVSIAAAVDLFGGLDCSSWAYTETLTRLNGPVDEIALRVESTAGGTQIVDFAIEAADASEPGGSSIAVLVDQAEVEFERCELTAGAGADGAAGDTPPDRGQDGLIGGDGVDGCVSSSTVFPADPTTVTCAVGGTSTGGQGGNGTSSVSAQGNGGAGGDAGENDGNVGGVGDPGQSCQTLDFGTEDCING